MEDYPRNLAELEARFSSEAACRSYLEQLRWPGGFQCPRCSGAQGWQMDRGLWICRSCRRQTSVTAGTIFHGTAKGLRTWFRAIWWVCSPKNGVSALGLKRILGLGSYETAWTWLHKLRRAMVRPGRDRLSGEVEVDEAFIGGPRAGKRGRGAVGKTIVLVAVECDGPKAGRIRLARTARTSAGNLEAFVQRAVEPGSLICTDGCQGYTHLPDRGYRHEATLMNQAGDDERKMLPHVHLVISLLKRWLLGTHHGGVQPHQLDYYLDEFTFRFNRRTSRLRGKLFYRLLQQAVQVEPAPYEILVKSPGT